MIRKPPGQSIQSEETPAVNGILTICRTSDLSLQLEVGSRYGVSLLEFIGRLGTFEGDPIQSSLFVIVVAEMAQAFGIRLPEHPESASPSFEPPALTPDEIAEQQELIATIERRKTEKEQDKKADRILTEMKKIRKKERGLWREKMRVNQTRS